MIWARFRTGDRWHLVIRGKTACGCSDPMVVQEADPPWEDRCQNCDNRIREAARRNKPKPKRKWVDPRKNYAPKNRIKWD